MDQTLPPEPDYRSDHPDSLADSRPSLTRRFAVGLTLTLFLALVYLVINHLFTASSPRPVDVATQWDHQIPFSPGWVWIYALNLPMPIALILATHKGDEFAELAAGFSLLCFSAFLIFVLFPVTAEGLRPVTLGDGLSNWGVSVYYRLDGQGNCLPSLHVALSCYSGLWGFLRFRPWRGRAYLLLGLAISISTMMVKQHWIADVVLGALMGFCVAWAQLQGWRIAAYLPAFLRRAISRGAENPAS